MADCSEQRNRDGYESQLEAKAIVCAIKARGGVGYVNCNYSGEEVNNCPVLLRKNGVVYGKQAEEKSE